MLYKERKTKYISAYQFLSFEDIKDSWAEDLKPGTVFFNKEKGNEAEICPKCGKYFREHAIYQGETGVCPGTYILAQLGQMTGFMSKENFEKLYEPIGKIWEEDNGSVEQD